MATFSSFTPATPPSNNSRLDFINHWLFRLGFASIFLVNAAYAAIYPDDFTGLLNENIIAGAIGHGELLVTIALFNDLFLGTLILIGIWKKYVYSWAGLWLLMVAGLKLMNLVTNLIE